MKSDAILFLIGGCLLLLWSYLEFSYGVAYTLNRYNSEMVEKGDVAFEAAVLGKAFLGVVGIIGYVGTLLKKK